jgi:hypothetical protein
MNRSHHVSDVRDIVSSAIIPSLPKHSKSIASVVLMASPYVESEIFFFDYTMIMQQSKGDILKLILPFFT